MLPEPLTVAARTVDPYLHLDNRGMVLFDGNRCVQFPGGTLGWVAETIQILVDEKRATRRQGDHVFGGFVSEDGTVATIYAGPHDDLATLQVDVSALSELYKHLRPGAAG
jgi:hypothetical protein